MEECDYVVTMPLVNLNGSSVGVSLANKAYGRLKAGDVVQAEIRSHSKPGLYETMRTLMHRGDVIYLSLPASWGLRPGELVTVRMNKIIDKREDLDGTEDARSGIQIG